MITFTWDEKKIQTNINKHKIDFKEAAWVFLDNEGLLINDLKHSEDEERYILIGLSNKGNVLVVVHTYDETNEIVRIISARKATKKEEKQYWEEYRNGEGI